MSTHTMKEVEFMRSPGLTAHAATVPGFGEVLVLVTAAGLVLTLPDQAVTTEQDLAAIRRDLGEVRDLLRSSAGFAASREKPVSRKGAKGAKKEPDTTGTQPFRTGMSKAEYDASCELARNKGIE